MITKNWYKTEKTYSDVQKEIKGKRFLHMRFELPRTAPSLAKDFVNSDDVLCVDLYSDLAKVIFRQDFIDKYIEFVDRSLKARNAALSSSTR